MDYVYLFVAALIMIGACYVQSYVVRQKKSRGIYLPVLFGCATFLFGFISLLFMFILIFIGQFSEVTKPVEDEPHVFEDQ